MQVGAVVLGAPIELEGAADPAPARCRHGLDGPGDTVRGRVCDTPGGMGGGRQPPAPGGPPVGSERDGERSGTHQTNFLHSKKSHIIPPCSEIYRSAPES